MLFAVGLAFLRLARDDLLQIRDPGALCMRLRQSARGCYACQPMLDLAFEEVRTLSNGDLRQRRRRHLDRLRLKSGRRTTGPAMFQ